MNEYLLNLLNSDFENWRKANPDAHYTEFPFSLKKVGSSNPMFDVVKINDISKNIISKISGKELTRAIIDWANEFDQDFAAVLLRNQEMAEALFSLDRDGAARPRKDISHASEVKELFSYMFDEYYDRTTSLNFDEKQPKETIVKLLTEYKKVYSVDDDKQAWFEKLKEGATACGYVDMKTYKANPEAYVGNIADASNIVRVAVTGRTNTPDLCSLMQMLGKDKVLDRIDYVVSNLK